MFTVYFVVFTIVDSSEFRLKLYTNGEFVSYYFHIINNV